MKGLINDFDFTSKTDMVKANVTENILNKGDLDNNFGPNNDTITIPKKGSEMIDKLQTVVYGKQLQRTELESRIKELKGMITAPLTKEIDEYYYRGYKQQITDMSDCLFLEYPYELTCFRDDMNTNYTPQGSVTANSFVVDKQTAEMCSKFNQMVFRCIDVCAEICLATTMLNNIEPNGKYLLNMQQLKSLGF